MRRQDSSSVLAAKGTKKPSPDDIAEHAAVQVLRASGASDFSAVAVASQEGSSKTQDMQDITSLFLEPTVRSGPPLKPCSTFVYRGLIRKLQGTQHFYAGLLGGMDSTVLDVILVETVEELHVSMRNPELQKRWKERGFNLLGLTFWGEEPPETYVGHLEHLGMSGGDALLLQISTITGRHTGWEISIASEVELDDLRNNQITPVGIALEGHSRRKGDEYIVTPLKFLGVTMADHVSFLANQAVRAQATKAVSQTKAAIEKALKDPFEVRKVPPDGKCCFHAIVAGLNMNKYLKIPRNLNGYATHHLQQKVEERSAQRLIDLVTRQAAKEGVEFAGKSGTVDVADLHRVGTALGISIRCTVAEQVGRFYFHIYIYMLIYILYSKSYIYI